MANIYDGNYIKAGREMALIIKGNQKFLLREMFKNKHFAILNVIQDSDKRFSFLEYTCRINEIGSNISNYYLYMEDFGYRGFKKKIREVLGKNIKLVVMSDVEKALSFLNNKELTFYTSYFIEEYGNRESSLVNHILTHKFSLKPEDMHFLYDDTYDVKIFMRELPQKGVKVAINRLQPKEAKRFDITAKITSFLKELSEAAFRDDSDLTCEYETKEGELSAQYFLTRYHSNPEWYLNPVCFFNFRISVFVLPGFADTKDIKNTPVDSIINRDDGKKYMLDSIHFTSDICFDLDGFKNLMKGHYFDVYWA